MAKHLSIAHERLFMLQSRQSNHEYYTLTILSPPIANSLLGLPIEKVKKVICCSLSEVASLHALISTCSSFFYPFLNLESSILSTVIHKQMNKFLTHNAQTVLMSSVMMRWTRESADNLMVLFTTGGASFSNSSLTFRNALALSRMHDHVQDFADRFLRLCACPNSRGWSTGVGIGNRLAK